MVLKIVFHRHLRVSDTFSGILKAQIFCTNSAEALAQINTMAEDYIGGPNFHCHAITGEKKRIQSHLRIFLMKQ